MKKFIYAFSFLICLAVSIPAIAQVSIGARAAANLSNIEAEEDGESEDTNNRFGIALGLVAEIGVSDMFAIQPELLFSQHGTETSESETLYIFSDTMVSTFEGKIRYSYIQIPILAKIKLGSERFGFNILAGPHVGLGIGKAELEYEFTQTINGVIEDQNSGSDKENWKDAGLKTLDFGITGGVGISIPAGPGTLGVDARYQLGIANISDDSDITIMNRNVQIGLSYILPIGM